MTKLEQLENKIKQTLHNTLNNITELKEKYKFTITNEQFSELKHVINNTIYSLSEDTEYDIYYYFMPISTSKSLHYVICIDIIKDFEIIQSFQLPHSIYLKQRTVFYYNDVKDIELRELLVTNGYGDELVHFMKELSEYETDCTLDEGWLDLGSNYIDNKYKSIEREYYKTLSEAEKIAFAKGHSYTYTTNFIYKPVEKLFRYYNIDMINTLFNEIEFRYKN